MKRSWFKHSKILCYSALLIGAQSSLAATLSITTANNNNAQTSTTPHISFRGCKGTFRTQYQFSPTQGSSESFIYDEDKYGTLKQVTLSTISDDAWKVADVKLDGISILAQTTSISIDPSDYPGSVQSHTLNIDVDAQCDAIPYCVNVAGPWFYNRDEGEFLYTYTEKEGRPVFRRTDGERWLWFANGQWKIWKPTGGSYWWQAKWTGNQAINPIDSHSNINQCSEKTSLLFMHGGGNLQTHVTDLFKTATGSAEGEGDLAYINTAASAAINANGYWQQKFDQVTFFHDRPDTFDFTDFAKQFAHTDSQTPENIQFRAQGVYIRGGSQSRLRSAYVNTAIDDQVITQAQQLLLNLKEYGIPMLGVSAGTAFFSDPTNSGNVQIRGMGATPGVIVDQHFKKRGREARLIAALELYPDMIGLGIDENSTAIMIDDYTVQVVNDANGTCDPGDDPYDADCYGLGVEVFYNAGSESRLFQPGEIFDLRDFSPYLNQTFGE